MSSKRAWCAIALVVGATRAWAAPPAFVAAQLGVAPEPAAIEIRGALATNVAAILGHAYPRARVAYWRVGDKTVWILDGRGRSGWFTAGFVVAAGRIALCSVLDYRESRGREVRSRRFLRQFEGLALRRGTHELDGRVDGITGATISVNAMRNLARLALLLEGERAPEEGATTAGGL